MAQQSFAEVHKQAQVQKQSAGGILQRKCERCREKEKILQRSAFGPAPETASPIVHDVLRSPGQPLDKAAQTFTRPCLSHDFSQIPVHSRLQGRIQAKFAVNAPGDIYEQEADRVADQVLAEPDYHEVSAAPPRIQRLAGSSGGQMEAPASVNQALASPGRPLEPTIRKEMEERFGHDFSRVRVYSDAAAELSARELKARAFTVGENVLFGKNQFVPESSEGRRLLAHELTHVVQRSITNEPTDLSANVFRAPAGQGIDGGSSANITEYTDDESTLSNPAIHSEVNRGANSPAGDGNGSILGKAVKCSDELSFSLQRLKPSLEPDKHAVILNADEELIIPNIEFQLNAAMRANKQKRIKDSQVRQWKIGIIQNVHRSRTQADYSDPEDRDDLIDCGLIDEKETTIDCTNGKPWYNPPKRAFVLFPRLLYMSDNPQLDKPSVHGPDSSGTLLTGGECPLDTKEWGACPDDTERQPSSQTTQSNHGPKVATSIGLTAKPESRTARMRFQENCIQRPIPNISSTTPILQRKTVQGLETDRLLDEDSGTNENGISSRSILKEQIESFQNTCSEISSIKCVNGEIVENLPKCIEKAPCGIAECVKQHELSHAKDVTMLFQSRLGRHPCRHKDGIPFADGFDGFGDDFVGETGEDRTWKRFLLRSELKAYGVEVRCLREMRRNSKERLCRRALTLEASEAAYRRFLAAIGINPRG